MSMMWLHRLFFIRCSHNSNISCFFIDVYDLLRSHDEIIIDEASLR